MRVAKLRGGLPRLPTATQRAGTRLASRQRHDSEWTVTARGLRAVPIGLGREGRREPTVRITKLRGGLPRLPSVSELEARRSSTPGQLPDLAVGLGRRDDAGIGHTARPLPIAVADSPIEAASPDPQQPMCFLE